LFKYLDDEGKRQTVQSEDVNAYLQDITGRDITAKDFRTWAGTMLVAEALRKTGPAETRREAEKNIVAAVDITAKRLGNTRSVCRKYYIHPALIEAYLEGSVLPPLPERKWSARKSQGPTLRQHEMDVLAFIKARLKGGVRRAAQTRRKAAARKLEEEAAALEETAAKLEENAPEPGEEERDEAKELDRTG
jgi:DNA topoisomerase-1